MNIHENVKKAVEWLIEEGHAVSKRELAQVLGYNESSFSQIVNGRVKVSDRFLNRLKNLDPRLNIAWIRTGYGDMVESPRVEAIPSEERDMEFVTSTSAGAKFYRRGNRLYMAVRHVPYAAFGQFANEADSLEPVEDDWTEEIYEVDRVAHGHYLSFEVKGDSMDTGSRQSFEAGDRVLVRELERELWRDPIRFRDYPYWVVVFDSSVLIKQLISHDIQKGILTFHSLNPSPEYADFSLRQDEVRRLYYVIRKKPKEVFY